MTTFAVLRDPEVGATSLECIYNRTLTSDLDDGNMKFIVMSERVHELYEVDSDYGEVLLYSPHYRPDLSCMWVGQSIDFDYTTDNFA